MHALLNLVASISHSASQSRENEMMEAAAAAAAVRLMQLTCSQDRKKVTGKHFILYPGAQLAIRIKIKK